MDEEMKQGQAGSTAASDSQELSRRNFMRLGIGALSALALVEIGAAGVIFLQTRGKETVSGGLVTVGMIDEFPLGSVIEFPEHRFFLIRSQDGGFLAVHNRCTHLGCTVYWEPQNSHFVCPCHASSFDFYGDFESPPVPRPLDTLAVEIKDGTVTVDTSALQQRERFDPAQLVYA
jgi:Rieske Fe-S protein